jgi:signal transduction histidine kinase
MGLGFSAGAYLQETRGTGQLRAVALAAGSVLPVALMFRAPLLAWRIAYVMLFLGVLGAKPAESWPWNPVQIFGFLAVLGALALAEDSGVAAWAVGFSLVPVFLFADRANAWGAAVLLVVIALLGDMVARRRQSSRALAEQAELNELERARRGVLEERARIAREMHDVVAHHMSMIAVQAETAPYRLAGLPDPARQELATIATAARAALADMRRLLGVLRAEDDETPRAPQPGLGDVRELVETARRAGVPVTATLPEADGVPQAVGLAAYRIVQEALANAARHAPGGTVRIAGRVTGDRLELVVRNGPAVAGIDPPSLPAGAPGHGLVGMRERAALLGGTLSAGRDGSGGYTVVAVLPFGRVEEPE